MQHTLQRINRVLRPRPVPTLDLPRGRRVLWTLGNLLILLGVYLLLFVGGLLAEERYNVYAASGANVATSAPVAVPPPATINLGDTEATPTAVPPTPTPAPVAGGTAAESSRRSFDIPLLNNQPESQITSAIANVGGDGGPSLVSRIVIPTLGLDRQVVEVGSTIEQQEGQDVQVWSVDTYRVGHHGGTSNPGGGGNIVLSGHSGGDAYPFNDIYYLKAGDRIQLTSNGVLYDYAVSDHIVVDEVGQPLERRLENARWIEPTDEEVITMVACWPLSGPNKFDQRIIIRAKPVDPLANIDPQQQRTSGWTSR